MTAIWRLNLRAPAMLGLLLAAGLMAAPPAQAWDEVIDPVMYSNPKIPMPRVIVVYPKMDKLWLEVLQRPEADFQRQAALTIALAHKYGMKGLEAAVGPLLEVMERSDQHLSARLAAIEALIELDARETAPRLFAVANSGNRDLRDLIEPALARWDYKPMRKVWLDRVEEEPTGSALLPDGLLLAVKGLGEVREEKAVPALRRLALSPLVSSPIRLEAARALGVIRTSGLEENARQLIAEASTQGAVMRLAAASLLRHHQGDEAVRLLQELALDAEAAVSAAALPRLVEIDPKLVVPALAHALASYDPKVGAFAIEVLLRRAASQDAAGDGVEHFRLLADRLNDPHPVLRVRARKALHELAAKADYRQPIIDQGMRIVSGTDWRGQEQAAILLTLLDHKPVAQRFVELLKSNRAEVMVAVAWGLRRLAVPATLPAALDHYQKVFDQYVSPNKVSHQLSLAFEAVDDQLSQLGQFFGQSRYRPADAALRLLVPRYNPRSTGPAESRAAAIWALGLLHEGQPDHSLVQAFEGRLSDVGGPMIPPEHPHVRSMSAISMARMKAKEALPTLRRFYPGTSTNSIYANACGWAIEQLTGEVVPPPGTVDVRAENFRNFLLALPPEREKGK